MFTPPMPGDVMVNFYINLSKLCLTVYQLHVLPPNTTKVRTCDSLQHYMKLHTASCDQCFFVLSLILIEFQASWKLSVAQPWSNVVSPASFLSFNFLTFLSFFLSSCDINNTYSSTYNTNVYIRNHLNQPQH